MSHRESRFIALFALAVPIGAALAPSGFAQEGAVLEEILVTAQRRETALQETPVAITVFGEERIQDLGIFNVADLSGRAPNTTALKQPASSSNTSLRIRGVGSGETSLLVDPKAGLYIDGAYLSKTVGAVFDLVDLESMEVLRGPQGTLFGRNSTGGALNITTAKPSGEFGMKLQASAGNDGYQRYMGSIDLPEVGEMLSAKVSGILKKTDGWAKNTYSGQTSALGPSVGNGALVFVGYNARPGQQSDLGSEDNQAFRIALRLQPNDQLTFDYAYDDTDNESVPAPFQIVKVKDNLYNGFTTTPFPFAALGGELFTAMAAGVGDPERRRDEFTLDNIGLSYLDVKGHTFTAALDLGAVTLKYIFADRETQQYNDGSDLDGGAYLARDLFYGGGMLVPTPGFHASIREGFVKMTTHELQLFGELMEGRLNYTLGYYNYEEEVYQDNPQTFGLPIAFLAGRDPLLAFAYGFGGFCNVVPGVGPVCVGSQRLPLPFPFPGADPNLNGFVDFVYGQDSESWALYGQFTYALTDQLSFTGGLRYTDDEKDAFLFNENLGMTSVDQRLVNAQSWDNLSYLLNLSYAVNEDLHVYLTHSTSYNAGGFNARAGSVSGFTFGVDEEEVSAIDAGLKAEWLNGRVRTNLALFRNKFDDLQIAQFEAGSGGASSRLVNAGKATYQGIELDAVAILAEGLIADFNFGYLDAEFDEYVARNPGTDQEQDIADATTVPAPETTASIGLQYDFRPTPMGTLSLRFDATHTGKMRFHPFQNLYDSAKARWLLDARASLNGIDLGGGDLRISLWIKNLADEEYREWGIDFASLGYAGATWGQPRTYGIDLVYQMGH